jgi:cytochrome c556
VALEAKLPIDFLKRGRALHQDFDRIADDAEQRKDARRSLALLGETLNKCVACHATYALVPAAPGTAPGQ